MNRIKELRNKKGMTAKELGDVLGVHEKYIFMLENGTRTPSFELAFKIAETFEKPIDVIWER